MESSAHFGTAETNFRIEEKMVELNNDMKTMGIAINLQRMFNPLVEAATMRLQDPQTVDFSMAVENMNVSFRPSVALFDSIIRDSCEKCSGRSKNSVAADRRLLAKHVNLPLILIMCAFFSFSLSLFSIFSVTVRHMWTILRGLRFAIRRR